MIGNRLIQLLNELNTKQLGSLASRCTASNDKAMNFFVKFLRDRQFTHEALMKFMNTQINKNWPASSEDEQALKFRRFSSLFADEVESVILEYHLKQDQGARMLIMAQALEKKGNVDLIDQYFDKSLKYASEKEDHMDQLVILKGKFRLKYASNNDRDLSHALQLNDEFLNVLKFMYEDRLIEYYHNKTNLYIEKSALIHTEKQLLENEISAYLKNQTSPLNCASLCFSLAKLNYNQGEKMYGYLDAGKCYLASVEDKNSEYWAFYRKVRFLELRLEFFNGADNEKIIALADEIIGQEPSFTVLNNHTLFYKILCTILDDKLQDAEELLSENHVFFRGNTRILEQFLLALLYAKKGETKSAVKLLNELMYVSNYFFAIFSRLLFIKLKSSKGNIGVIKSIVDSTTRLLTVYNESPLGHEAHLYTLFRLKEKVSVRKIRKSYPKSKLTVLHRYLLEGLN
jgi:hypothetical protein